MRRLGSEFNLNWDASVPILVVDLNGDGKNELIVGQGHGYGLTWLERHETSTGTVDDGYL